MRVMVSIGFFLRIHWLRFSAASSERRISPAVKGARKYLPGLHNAHSLCRQIASLDTLLWIWFVLVIRWKMLLTAKVKEG